MNELSSQILKFRRAAGLTQEQLAEKLGVTPQSVSNWERRGAPDISMLPIIAGFFGVTIDELMGMNAENREQRKNSFWTQYYMIESKDERLNLLIEEYRRSPHDCRVMVKLMESIAWDKPENKLFVEELCNKILTESSDPIVRERALAYMCHISPPESRKKWLDQLTPAQARQYIAEEQFAPGSMLPKVEAAVKFAESKPGCTALITLLEKARDGIQGHTGTVIRQ